MATVIFSILVSSFATNMMCCDFSDLKVPSHAADRLNMLQTDLATKDSALPQYIQPSYKYLDNLWEDVLLFQHLILKTERTVAANGQITAVTKGNKSS